MDDEILCASAVLLTLREAVGERSTATTVTVAAVEAFDAQEEELASKRGRGCSGEHPSRRLY